MKKSFRLRGVVIALMMSGLPAIAQNTTVSVNLAAPGVRIPDDFIGLSLEANIARPLFFGTPGQPNDVFFRLLRNLGAGSLRIGGLSQDQYCWAQSAAPNPGGCNGALLPADAQSYYYASSRSGWPLLLGVNLGQNSGRWARREIDEGIAPYASPDQIMGVEIGNEPDGFFSDQLPNGGTIRPDSYQLSDYFNDFQGYLAAFAADAFASGVPVAGPAFDGRWHQPELQQFLDQFGGNLGIATMHWYPTVKCRGPVSISDLLAPGLLIQYKQIVGGWQRTAQSHGLGLQLTETNSVACSGMPGVSDAFASAIWGLDWTLYSAQLGLRRINFHTGTTRTATTGEQNSYYNAIASGPSPAGSVGFTNDARPLYYALHMFASAGPGNAMLPVTVQSTANVTAYATTRCPACPVHVFVINKDLSATAPVVLDLSQPAQSASALTLSATSLSAMLPDISYGGTVFDGSSGVPAASRSASPLAAGADGTYSFELKNASAILLTFVRQGVSPPSPAAIVNAASGQSAVAPGSLASIYGSNLTGATEQAASNRLPTRLADGQITINGFAAPQIYASPGQVNFQVPFEAVPGQSTVIYANGALISGAIPINVVPFAPAVFTLPAVSATQGAVLVAGTVSLAAPLGSSANARPAHEGEFLSIYCTGLGATTPRSEDGIPITSGALPATVEKPVVTLNGAAAEVTYSGLAPEYPGLYQVNVRIPAGAPKGNAVPLRLSIKGVAAPVVTVAIN
jgi:uncharacterized protein (TIGR03437 family)